MVCLEHMGHNLTLPNASYNESPLGLLTISDIEKNNPESYSKLEKLKHGSIVWIDVGDCFGGGSYKIKKKISCSEKKKKTWERFLVLNPPPVIFSKIVGSTFLPHSQKLISSLKKGDVIDYQRQPDNPYDTNAIGLYIFETEGFLGYIKKTLAFELAPAMDAGQEYIITVDEVTGGHETKQNYGCNIKIEKKQK